MPHREPILLNINDNEANRYAVTRMLRAAGFQVLEGGTGAEALRISSESRPDLVILDVKLPDLNGIEVCRRLKSDPRTSHAVVLHLSANYVRTENKVEGLESGADGYLTQPVDSAELLATVRSLLRLRRAEAESRQAAAQWKTTFDSLGDGMCLLDGEGRVMRANRSFHALFGGDTPSVLGRSFVALVRAAAGEAELPPSCGETLDCRDESTVCLGSRWYRVAANPVEGDEGAVTGAVRIFTDITSHQQLQESLRQRAEDLAEADRRKDEFLAMLAHELRNPLAAIVNSLHLLESTQTPTAPESRTLRVLTRQSQHMARMVDDLLDVSRFNRGHIELRRSLVDLRQVVQHAAEARRQAIQDKGLGLELSLPPGDPLWLEGDATRLEQVVSNLLDNARKYTPVGGRVFVEVKVEGAPREGVRQAVLRVRDTGIGMAPRLRDRIFELFVQGEQQLDRSRGGLGIGLTLVRRLVELHGGEVMAYSEGEGKGSELVVKVPLAAAADVGAPVETRIMAPESGVSRRVLLVEDNDDTREVLRELLEMWGHQVEVAEDGFKGVERFGALRPHVALVDLGLPGMDGFQVARKLRESQGGQDVFLVALTGYSGEHRTRTVEAGFDLHLVKPVKPDELEHLLEHLPARGAPA